MKYSVWVRNIIKSTVAGRAPQVVGLPRRGEQNTRPQRYRGRPGSPFGLTYDGPNPILAPVRPPGARLKRIMRAEERAAKLLAIYGRLGSTPLVITSVPPDDVLLHFFRFSTLQHRRSNEKGRAKAWAAVRNFGTAGAPIIGLPASTNASDSCRLLSEVQRHLLEPVIDSGVTWSLWTQQEVHNYMIDRINKFLLDTGLVRTRVAIPNAAGNAFVNVPQDMIQIKRVTFTDVNGTQVLTRVDQWMLDHAYPGWHSGSGTLYGYIENPQNSLIIQLAQPPSLAGTVSIEYVPKQQLAIGVCEPFLIPAVFIPFVKYGILADMLMKQGEANDPQRATYCEQRFQDGIELAKAFLGNGGQGGA